MARTQDSGFDPVPGTLEEVLEPAWLSAALAARYPGCRVAAVTVLSHTWTIATKVRLGLTYDDPGDPAAPEALCVKGYFRDPAALGGAGGPEARYYRELAGRTPACTAECHYVGFDEDSGRSILLLEDLARPGTELRDALTPFSADESAAALEELALLHAGPWAPGFLAQTWLAPRMGPMAQRVPVAVLQELLDRPRGDGLPDEVRRGQRVSDAMAALEGHLPSQPTLLHGDTHAGNIFFRGPRAGLYDWQLVQRGTWALDVSYHLGAVLETEVRRANERELLAGYWQRRAALGTEVPRPDQAFDDYRRYLAYGYFLWAMTRFTDEALTTATIRRLGQAVADHDTFGLLGV